MGEVLTPGPKIQYDDWVMLKPCLNHTVWTAHITSIMINANITKRFIKLCQNFYAGLIHLLVKLSLAHLLSQRKGSKLNCYCTDILYKPFLSNLMILFHLHVKLVKVNLLDSVILRETHIACSTKTSTCI